MAQNGRSQVVDDYLDYEAPKNPGFQRVRIQRSDQQRAVAPKPRDTRADLKLMERTREFKHLMLEYDESSSQAGLHEKFNIGPGKVHSWKEVFAIMDAAVEQYNGTARKNVFVKIGRSIGDYSDIAESFTSLLPSGDYGSTLCGALKIMFKAASTLSQHRESILGCFNQVPVIIHDTSTWMDIFSTDEELKPLAQDLYLAILDAVTFMLNWLIGTNKRGKVARFFKAGVDPSRSGEGIRSHTDMIQRRTEAFKIRVEHIKGDLQKQVHINAKQSRNMMEGMDAKLSMLGPLDEHMRLFAQGQEDALGTFTKLFNQSISEVKQFYQQAAILMENNQLTLESFLLASAPTPDWNYQDETSPQPPEDAEFDYILRRFTSTRELVDPECDAIIREVTFTSSSPSTHQEKAMWVLQNRQFSAWFGSKRRGHLMINDAGGDDDATYNWETSAMSYLTASLRNLLIKNHIGLTLAFFCHLHRSRTDEFTGPSGMMKQLTAQLLLLVPHEFNLEPLNLTILEQAEDSNLETLCEIFSELVRQLPLGTQIVCLIDGVSAFDNQEHKHDMAYALRFLVELVHRAERAVLKLFLTRWENLGPGLNRVLSGVPTLHVPDDEVTGSSSFGGEEAVFLPRIQVGGGGQARSSRGGNHHQHDFSPQTPVKADDPYAEDSDDERVHDI